MKIIALVLVSSLLATCAFGQGKPVKKPAVPKTIKCAVQTADDVNIQQATKKHMFADYKGNRYFFCCPGCPEAFKKNPAKYSKSPHIKTPKA